jgi:5,5'-dehydrodivanillate O-demethylase
MMPGVTLASEGYGRMTSDDFADYRGGHALMPRGARYNVPIDDTHTMMVRLIWLPEGTTAHYAEPLLQTPDWRQEVIEPYREYRRMEDVTELGYDWPANVSAQDATILDSMGPLSPREGEHLMPSDKGVAIVRRLLRDALTAIESGRDPKGTVRDATRNRSIEVPVFEDVLGRTEFERATHAHEAAQP